jgi:hypothetical protein
LNLRHFGNKLQKEIKKGGENHRPKRQEV